MVIYSAFFVYALPISEGGLRLLWTKEMLMGFLFRCCIGRTKNSLMIDYYWVLEISKGQGTLAEKKALKSVINCYCINQEPSKGPFDWRCVGGGRGLPESGGG